MKKSSILMLIVGLVVGLGLTFGVYYFFFRNETKVMECPKCAETKCEENECPKCTETKCEECKNNTSSIYFKRVKETYELSQVGEDVNVGDKIVFNNNKLVSINNTKFSNLEIKGELDKFEAYDFGNFYGINVYFGMCEENFAFYDKNGKKIDVTYSYVDDNIVGISNFYVKDNSIYATILKGCGTGSSQYETMRLLYENNKIKFVK